MIQPDTVKLLRECDAGIKMGIKSIDDVADHVKNADFRQLLNACKDEHDKLDAELRQLLGRYRDEGKEPNFVAEKMAKIKTEVMLHAFNNSRIRLIENEAPGWTCSDVEYAIYTEYAEDGTVTLNLKDASGEQVDTCEFTDTYTNDLSEIKITAAPSDCTYAADEKFDPRDMVVTAYYSNGETKEISDYTWSPEVLSEDVTEVTISYKGKTAVLAVTVEASSGYTAVVIPAVAVLVIACAVIVIVVATRKKKTAEK